MADKYGDATVYRVTTGWTFAIAALALCAFHTVEADVCPTEVNPPSVVVRYGDPVTVNCTVSTDHLGMGWVAPQNPVDRQT
ncbi:intercellular adhesion molecule 3-like, partial [Arapaima gigas]